MSIKKRPEKELEELKQQIEECKRVVKDLDLLFEGVTEYGVTLNKAGSVMLGLAIMYESRFEKLDTLMTCLEAQLPPVVEDPREIA